MHAVYPGSFDPLTNGHLDLIKRGCAVFDQLTVLILTNSTKQSLFSKDERCSLIRAVLKRERLDNAVVDNYEGLTANYCREHNIGLLLRGLRNGVDLEYEQPIAAVNRTLYPGLETLFLNADPQLSQVSSSVIKEMARYDQPQLKDMIPPEFVEPLKNRLKK